MESGARAGVRRPRKGQPRARALVARGMTIVFLGSSGVGKSTIIDRLLGYDRMKTAPVHAEDGRERMPLLRLLARSRARLRRWSGRGARRTRRGAPGELPPTAARGGEHRPPGRGTPAVELRETDHRQVALAAQEDARSAIGSRSGRALRQAPRGTTFDAARIYLRAPAHASQWQPRTSTGSPPSWSGPDRTLPARAWSASSRRPARSAGHSLR
jgi:hypothetical protein